MSVPVGDSGSNIKPAVENEMAEATRNHNITSFDHLSDQIMMLQSERDATVYKKESLRTAQRRRKRQNITRVKGTEESEARKLSVADPRTFTTLYACIQVSHVCVFIMCVVHCYTVYISQAAQQMYGMLTTPYGVRSDDGYQKPPEREFNPNNVVNFDESTGLTCHWCVCRMIV